MPATAQRGHAPVRPMNRTGQIYAQQLREKQARDAAKDVDLAEVKRQARAEGFSAGWDAAIAWVIKEYDLDADEPGDEDASQ